MKIEIFEENYQYGVLNDIDHLLPLYQEFFELD